jgi:hypothetical protein
METDRRHALELAGTMMGLAILRTTAAHAGSGIQPTGRTEIAPGVFESFFTSQEVRLTGYRMLWLTQLAFEPGSAAPADMVANDTVVLMVQGLLRVRLDEEEFVLCNADSMGSLWAFPQGSSLAMANTGADLAIMQVIELLPRL